MNTEPACSARPPPGEVGGRLEGGGQWAIRPETLDHLVTSFVF